jgi:hypothetical protein
MTTTWSGKAPTNLYIKWDAGEWEADPSTDSAITRAIFYRDVVKVTATGPTITVTHNDQLALSLCAIRLWEVLLTPDQMEQMQWTNRPELGQIDDDPNVVY